MMEMFLRWTLLAGLGAAAMCDLKWRRVPDVLLWGVFVLLAAEAAGGGRLFRLSTGIGVLIGGLLLALSKLSEGKIGEADGAVFVWTGLVIGGAGNLCLLFAVLCAVALGGGAWQILKRRRRVEIPMIPLVFVFYAGGWLCGI